MQTAPKSLRLHIALLGRTNVGKSSLLNMLSGQDVAITSEQPGTTTDVVEKAMELLPIGPVVFLDTAGIDDNSALGAKRVERTTAVLNRTDVLVLVCEPNRLDAHETRILDEAASRNIPAIAIVNKCDLAAPGAAQQETLARRTAAVLTMSCATDDDREHALGAFKDALLRVCPDDFIQPPPLVGDLLHAGGTVIMIVPIDLQAPKGRLILPQVQTIRDTLDNDATAIVVKEREYRHVLDLLKTPPELVICDSQVVMKMVADTPPGVPCTTFSILFARLKGDLQALAAGAATIGSLEDGDRVLIAESCSHHAMEDDIGRVKIPRWIRQYTGADLDIQSVAGRDFPTDVGSYRLIVQCGGCMQNRRELLSRIQRAQAAGVAITNYGLCISETQGVLKRALSPFPAALDAYEHARKTTR